MIEDGDDGGRDERRVRCKEVVATRYIPAGAKARNILCAFLRHD